LVATDIIYSMELTLDQGHGELKLSWEKKHLDKERYICSVYTYHIA